MDLFEAISQRRSVRRFSNRPIEEDKLQTILQSIQQSPSWANQQCWHFIIIRNSHTREKISEYSYVESFFAAREYKDNPARKGIIQAPIVLVACADPKRSGTMWNQNYYLADIGIAAQNLMLSAQALGLGTVFVGVFNESKVKDLLNIPDPIRVVGIFPLGYPKEPKSKGPSRKSLDKILHMEKW